MFRKNFHQFNRFTMVFLTLAILAALVGGVFQPAAAADVASLNIVSVVKGQSVTINVTGMPASKDFRVLLNKIGTQGEGGTSVGTATTSKEGSFTKTFTIPAVLKNEARIAVRIEATDKTGWYAYNWFVNSTSGSTSTSSGSTSSSSNTGSVVSSGNLTITDVEEDTAVDFTVKSLAANSNYRAWFDWKNRSGVVLATQAGTVRTDASGAISTSIHMPSILQDRYQLRLRIQTFAGTNVAASPWFYNADSDEDKGGSAPSGSESGLPYLVIGAVVKNETVTVEAYNLPKKMEFDVYMAKMGSQAENGTYVESVTTSKNAGPYKFTFDIPTKLKDRDQIAIRFEDADGDGYVAYSWFNNVTASSGQ